MIDSILLRLLPMLVLLMSSCASTSDNSANRLPFHVAVMPVDMIQDASGVGSYFAVGDEPEEKTGEGDIELIIRDDEFSGRLFAELDGIFASATLLEANPAWDSLSVRDRNKEWVAAARAAGADMIVSSQFTYDPRVDSQANDNAWLSIPMFLLGGPFVWLINDRSYALRHARLDVRLHDLSAMTTTSGATLSNKRSSVHQSIIPFEVVTLDLIDRASGLGDYVYSVFWPSGFLATDTEDAQLSLERAVREKVCRSLGDDILGSTEVIVGAENLVAFHPTQVAVHEGGVRGKLQLAVSSSDRMESYGYWQEGNFVREDFLDEERSDNEVSGTSEYEFNVPMATAGARAGTVKMQFTDGDQNVRTFTIPIANPKVNRVRID